MRSSDYNYIEEMIQAGMVERLIDGTNFPRSHAIAANFKVVRPDIDEAFDLFRYQWVNIFVHSIRIKKVIRHNCFK